MPRSRVYSARPVTISWARTAAAGWPTTSSSGIGRSGGETLAPQLTGSGIDGLDHRTVACASAEGFLDRLLDLIPRRRRGGEQKGIGRHQHPRRAEATLERPHLGKRPLERVEHALQGQPLKR